MAVFSMREIQNSFPKYLILKWQFLGLSHPTSLQMEIADYLQFSPDRRIIEAFRGIGKTWITASYCEWRWLKDRDYKFIICSGNAKFAGEITAFIKKCIEEFDVLACLRHPNKSDALWGNERLNVYGCKPAHAPSLKSVGINGQIDGSRANEIIGDDIETRNNSITAEMRDKLFHLTGNFENIIVPGGTLTFLGTPQSEESVYNRLSEERNYDLRVWPARIPEQNRMDFYIAPLKGGAQPRSRLKGQLLELLLQGNYGLPTEPSRFPESELIKREAGEGRSEFLLQFMLDTSLKDRERFPLRVSDLIVTSVSPQKSPLITQWGGTRDLVIRDLPTVGFNGDHFHYPLNQDKELRDYEGSVLAVDPSGRGKDLTGYAVVNQLGGQLYVPTYGGLSGGYSDNTLITLCNIAKENRVREIVVEDNFGDGMFTKLLQGFLSKIYNVKVTEVHSTGQKEKRIISILEPVMNQHKLVFDIGAIREDLKKLSQGDDSWACGMYQLTRLTKDRHSCKHDDIIEAISIGVSYFTKSMSRDPQEAKVKFLEAQKKEDLKKFLRNSKCYPAGSAVNDTTRGTPVIHQHIYRRRT